MVPSPRGLLALTRLLDPVQTVTCKMHLVVTELLLHFPLNMMNPPLLVVVCDAVSISASVTTEITKGAVQSGMMRKKFRIRAISVI